MFEINWQTIYRLRQFKTSLHQTKQIALKITGVRFKIRISLSIIFYSFE